MSGRRNTIVLERPIFFGNEEEKPKTRENRTRSESLARASGLRRFLTLSSKNKILSQSSDAIMESDLESMYVPAPRWRRTGRSVDSWAAGDFLDWKDDSELLIERVRGFTYETGEKGVTSVVDVDITDTLKCVPWYTQHFYGKEHFNYIGRTSESVVDIFIVSVIKEEVEVVVESLSPIQSPSLLTRARSLSATALSRTEASSKMWSSYKVLLRTKDGDIKKTITLKNNNSVFSSPSKKSKIPIQKILENGFYEFSKKKVERIKDQLICEDLKNFEQLQLKLAYKFGLLYCAAGQTTEYEMFSNQKGSPDFEEFLDTIGERVELNGWPNYRGGLDVNNGTSGEQSLYTKFQEYEVMFHVSTLLPYVEEDWQRLERKRHIGNDVVVVVFQEGEQLYNPNTLQSNFSHIIVVIAKVEQEEPGTFYKITIANREGVAIYAPPLPDIPIIEKSKLKNFLLTKLINGEDSALQAPQFKMRLIQARIGFLQEISQRAGYK